jgi:hypothetical protein
LAPQPKSLDAPARRGSRHAVEILVGSLILLWINVHISRDLFRNTTAPANSMHGFWAAIARWAGDAWFHPSWWPYWDCGIPFELTYAPGIPAMTALIAAVRHIPQLLAFNTVTGIVYCLGPIALFIMAAWIMRSPRYGFIVSLIYSLTSLTQLLSPDGPFAWREFWGARRIYVTAVWDDTPHLAAVSLLPLIILFLSLSIRRRRVVYYAVSSALIAMAALCSAFGPTDTALAAICLLFVLHRERLTFNIALIAGIGAFAWALTAPFLSPVVISAVGESSGRDGTGWTIASYTAVAVVILGWAILWHFLQHRTSDWRMRFFTLFAYLMTSVPMIAQYLNRQFLPQPTRYRLEMEMALAVFVVFALRPLVDRLPVSIRAGLLLSILALAGEQVAADKKFAKAILVPSDVPSMIESRVSNWTARNLPGVRVSMPGSVAQWSTLFNPGQEFTGSSWSMAYNSVQQYANDGIFAFENPAKPLLWLKAYGVGAICVPGAKSPVFWNTMRYPRKFDGTLPVLWQEEDTTIFGIPMRSTSLAHVVPESAVVATRPKTPDDVVQVERYVAALEDAALPIATFRWEGNNRFVIGLPRDSVNAVSVQVSWHPGWHAAVNGRKIALARDALGLMWMKPNCAAACEIQVDYNGGWQLRLLHWLSFAALATLTVTLLWTAFRAARISRRKLIS